MWPISPLQQQGLHRGDAEHRLGPLSSPVSSKSTAHTRAPGSTAVAAATAAEGAFPPEHPAPRAPAPAPAPDSAATARPVWNLDLHGIVSVRQQGGGSSSSSSSSTSQRGGPSWQQHLVRTLQMLQYRLLLLFRLPTWGKLLALILVGLPIVMLGSWLLVRVTDMAWGEAAQLAFYVLQNVPGADITGFSEAGARLVLVAIHLVSLYTFATLVGLLTEDVRATVEQIQCGNFPIPSRDHTVLLDASGDANRVIGTLRRVLETREAHGGDVYAGDIAILSTHPKDELDRMIADVFPKHATKIVTRYGNPIKVADLERVAAGFARTVLLLAADGPMGHVGPALQQQLCLTSLRSLHPHHRHHHHHHHHHHASGAVPSAAAQTEHQHQRRQRVVVESAGAVSATGAAVGVEADLEDPLQVTYVSSTSSAYRVAVQCAVQPGLAAVFDAVFCRADDASLRLVDLPDALEGRTFAEARRRFRRAVLCGLLPGPDPNPSSVSVASTSSVDSEGGRSIVFSPPDDRRLYRSDRLVLLAASQDDCRDSNGDVETPALPLLSPPYDGSRLLPSRFVLMAPDSCLPGTLLAALEEFAAPGCSVVVVSPEPCAGLPLGLPQQRSRLEVRNVVGDLLSPAALLAADVAAADAVILTGTDDMPVDEADALVVGTALLLQRLMADPWVDAEDLPALGGPSGSALASADSEEFWAGATRTGARSLSSLGSLSSVDFGVPAPVDEQGHQRPPRRPRPARPPRALTFVCSLQDPQNRSVLQHIGVEACSTAIRTAAAAAVGAAGPTGAAQLAPVSRGLSIEVIEPEALISGMLAQVGAEPQLVTALEDLLDEQGCEIYIKRCDRYGMAHGSRILWSQVSEIVRQRREVALGYLHRGRLFLAPPAEEELQPVPGDKLVVLSESFL